RRFAPCRSAVPFRGAALCHSPVAAGLPPPRHRRRPPRPPRGHGRAVGRRRPRPRHPAAVEEARATTPANAPATKEPQKQTVFGALVFAFIMGIMALGLVATLARGFVPDGLVGPA
ncbi:hypothetical protein BU14_0629s0005, partial [Porphyra umbilicalis]